MVNGKKAMTHDEQIKRWSEHFETILNCPEPLITHDFDSDEDSKMHSLDNMAPFTEQEVKSTINRQKMGKRLELTIYNLSC